MDDNAVLATYSTRKNEFVPDSGTGKLAGDAGGILAGTYLGKKVEGNIRAVQYGKFNEHDACLLLAEFRFGTSRSPIRIEYAEIKFKFMLSDAMASSEFVIERCTPDHIYGRVNSEQISTAYGVQAQASAAPVSLGLSWTKTRSSSVDHALEIIAEGYPQAKEVCFKIYENNLRKDGVPHVVNVGLMVLCDQAFQASVTVRVKAPILLLSNLWKKKESPLRFKPGVNFNPAPAIQINQEFHALTEDDWRRFVPYPAEVVCIRLLKHTALY